jgi:myo-inositol-1(or 4)-monophosphatase
MIDTINELQRMQNAIISACANHFSGVAPTQSQIYTKSAGSYTELVTAVDLSLSNDILAVARTALPESYSEEELPSTLCTADMLWQIDPLDGTDEFINGLPSYCGVSAALLKRLRNGTYESIAGILYLPATKMLVTGDRVSRSIEILQDGKRLPLPEYNKLSVTGYLRAVDPSDKAVQYYTEIGRKLGIPSSGIASGGAAHAFVSLITGKINVLCLNYDHSKEWDTSAAQPIIDALGGFLCDLDGRDFSYHRQDHFNRRGFLASIAFSKQQLLPDNTDDLLERRLTT